MSTVRFIADLHLGHENCAQRRHFNSSEDHDEFLIKQWNSVVGKKDITYILGDITMETSKHYHKLDRLNGIKYVVLGNHDMARDIPELLKYVTKVSGMVQYKGLWLTHCPVHVTELEYRVPRNIHGHLHDKTVTKTVYEYGYSVGKIDDERYVCVSCDQIDFKPKTLEELGIKR